MGDRFNWPDDTPLHEAVFQALGAASVCWRPIPEGVFDAEQAEEIGEELLEFMRRKQVPM